MARRIIGNLDCETDFAALAGRPAGPARRRRANGTRVRKRAIGALPRRVLETIAGMATLLRVFARQGDRLWLPAPVAREAMAGVPGLPRPILESGPLAELEPAGEILAWAETAKVAAVRPASAPHQVPPAPVVGHDLPWQLPLPAPQTAVAVNDRRFSLALAGELGCLLPGARAIASPAELDAHLHATGIDRWVLKAPFSAAGRWRLIHPGGALDVQTRRRLERLFGRHGELVFEPWMERLADVGCAAAVMPHLSPSGGTPDGLLRVSLHRLLVDRIGRFRGIELIADPREDPFLDPEEHAELERVLEGVATALRLAGYAGPFGIDAWRYRSLAGGKAFHPLGEINCRLTFGWVARALVDRVRGPLEIAAGSRVRLMFGKRQDDRADVRIVPLLHAVGSIAGPEAWLEVYGPQ